MIATLPEMRALTHDLTTSMWTLSAIGVLFEAGLVDHLREPHSVDDLAARCPALSKSRIERCLAVAAAVGAVANDGGRYQLAAGAMPFAQPPLRAVMGADIRANLMQALAFLDSSKGAAPIAGWQHTDEALLQAQGDASSVLPGMIKMNLAPTLGDLAARLDRPGARFLDVGVGVASLAIAMCRVWPEVHVVGLDTFDAPLAIARENVARAKLGDRIDLRKIAVEDFGEEESFDLAWLPAFFISDLVLARAAARIRASLRPGGWILLPMLGASGDDRQRAVGALVTDLWGGPGLTTAGLEAILKEAGFSSIRTMVGPPAAPAMVTGQR